VVMSFIENPLLGSDNRCEARERRNGSVIEDGFR